MIFLDFHPGPPTSAKAAKEQNTTRVNHVPQPASQCGPQVTKPDDISWQLKWMTEYDSLRKELQKSEEINEQRLAKITELEEEVKKIPTLTAQLVKSSSSTEKGTQTEQIQTHEMSVQTDEIDANEKSTQTDKTADNTGVMVSDNYVRNIHSYSQIHPSSSSIQKFKFTCTDCSFATNKKSTYDTHVAESCVRKPEKNMKCPVCKDSFTYHTLRLHLNHYATGLHRPKGEHANFTPSHHAYLLQQHKQLKSKK